MSGPSTGKKPQGGLTGSKDAFGEVNEANDLDLSDVQQDDAQVENVGSSGGGGVGANTQFHTEAADEMFNDLEKQREIESMNPDEAAVYFLKYCLTPQFIEGIKAAGGYGPEIRRHMREALREATGDENWNPAPYGKASDFERQMTKEIRIVLNRAYDYRFNPDETGLSSDERDGVYDSDHDLEEGKHDPSSSHPEPWRKSPSYGQSKRTKKNTFGWELLDESTLVTMEFNNALIVFADQRNKGKLQGFELELPEPDIPPEETLVVANRKPKFNVEVDITEEEKAFNYLFDLSPKDLSLITKFVQEGGDLIQALEKVQVYFPGTDQGAELAMRKAFRVPETQDVYQWLEKYHPHLGPSVELKEWEKISLGMDQTPRLQEIFDHYFYEHPGSKVPTELFWALREAYTDLESSDMDKGWKRYVGLSPKALGGKAPQIIAETGYELLNYLIQEYKDKPPEKQEIFEALRQAQGNHEDLLEEGDTFIASKSSQNTSFA